MEEGVGKVVGCCGCGGEAEFFEVGGVWVVAGTVFGVASVWVRGWVLGEKGWEGELLLLEGVGGTGAGLVVDITG